LAGHLATINELQAELAKAQIKQFELQMVDSDQDVKSEEFVSETPVIRMDASLKSVDMKLGLAQSDSEIEEDSFTKSELIIVNEDKPNENENY
jgi:fructose-specific phosphotransferase system component IIB